MTKNEILARLEACAEKNDRKELFEGLRGLLKAKTAADGLKTNTTPEENHKRFLGNALNDSIMHAALLVASKGTESEITNEELDLLLR